MWGHGKGSGGVSLTGQTGTGGKTGSRLLVEWLFAGSIAPLGPGKHFQLFPCPRPSHVGPRARPSLLSLPAPMAAGFLSVF